MESHSLIIAFTTFLALSLIPCPSLAKHPCNFPAVFNFGDSNSDTGGLSAVFGQAPPPNGRSYFPGPAGRYSDGRLIVDFIAESLGLPYLSAYLDALGANFSHGANFATAGSTIRLQNRTLQQSGFSPISLNVQYNEFYDFRRRSQTLRNGLGGIFKQLLPKEESFSRALYTFDIGQNDLTSGYFANMSLHQVKLYIPDVLQQFSEIVKWVHSQGGRFFWIHNTGPVGCLPYVLDREPVPASDYDQYGCATPFNDLAQYFNRGLKQAVMELRKALPDSAITYVDVYSLKYALVSQHKKYGFEYPLRTCCGHGGKYNFNVKLGCGGKKTINGKEVLIGKSCKNPEVYVNWDGVHYTQAANKWIFNQIKDGSYSDPPIPLNKVEVISEHKAIVFPMVKHPFVVGFLVAELPNLEMETCLDMQSADRDPWSYSSPHEAGALVAGSGISAHGFHDATNGSLRTYMFNADRQENAFHISRSLAMAYVMDQKAMLLQQSSWQNNLRMSNLVDQIRGSLSSIQSLSKMLSVHMKKNEIAYEILEDILLQGDYMRDTLQQLQDAVYLTKANIVHYNEETLKKMYKSSNPLSESAKNQLDNFPTDASNARMKGGLVSSNNTVRDMEMPMPPTILAPVQRQGIRSCNVSDVLIDLVEAVKPLARKQQRIVELSEQACSMQIAVEESSLRQALSNLIEGALLRTRVGGKVEIISTAAPAGGALIVIDDDGPDMHYMTQMHSLTPFGADLLSKERVEDNMTWNFVAGLTVACEILESFGCVVRVISPRCSDAALGSGGTRLELWLPSAPGTTLHNLEIPTQGA